MKKILIAIISLALVGSACLFALDGTVVKVNGKVEMQTGGDSWVVLKVGDSVPEGAVVSTGFKAQADIRLGGSLVTVYQLSRVTLLELVEGEDKVTTDIYLDAGSLAADVKPLNNKANGFQVQTSVVTSSVRGTQFVMNARPGTEAVLDVIQGKVDLQMPTGEKRTGTAGHKIVMADGHLASAFSKGSQAVANVSPITSPAEKSSSPLQIVAGELADGAAPIPTTGFVDASEIAVFETTRSDSAIEFGVE